MTPWYHTAATMTVGDCKRKTTSPSFIAIYVSKILHVPILYFQLVLHISLTISLHLDNSSIYIHRSSSGPNPSHLTRYWTHLRVVHLLTIVATSQRSPCLMICSYFEISDNIFHQNQLLELTMWILSGQSVSGNSRSDVVSHLGRNRYRFK